MEKAVLLAGNVQGVGDVTAEKIQAPEQKAKVEYYVIQSGDTLSKIAKTYLGDAMAYPKIFEANREVIQDPNKIYPGQKIRIPLGWSDKSGFFPLQPMKTFREGILESFHFAGFFPLSSNILLITTGLQSV